MRRLGSADDRQGDEVRPAAIGHAWGRGRDARLRSRRPCARCCRRRPRHSRSGCSRNRRNSCSSRTARRTSAACRRRCRASSSRRPARFSVNSRNSLISSASSPVAAGTAASARDSDHRLEGRHVDLAAARRDRLDHQLRRAQVEGRLAARLRRCRSRRELGRLLQLQQDLAGNGDLDRARRNLGIELEDCRCRR